MGQYQVTGPDGQKYQFEAATDEEAAAAVTELHSQGGEPKNFDTGFDPSQDSAPTEQGLDQNIEQADQVGRGYNLFNNALMGGYDEVIGLVEGGMEFAKGGEFSDGYARGTSNVRNSIARYEQRHPVESQVLGVAASLPTAMIPGGAAVRGASMASKVGMGMAAGGGYGAVQGYLSGEGGVQDRAVGGLIGAGVGAGIGGAVAPIGAGIGKLAGNSAGRKAASPGESIVAKEAGTFFEAAEQSGVAVKDRPLRRLLDLRTQMMGVGAPAGAGRQRMTARLRPKLHPNTLEALDIIDEAANAPTLTFADLMTTRQLLRDTVNAAYKADPKGADYHFADEALDAFDEWRGGLTGNDVYPGVVSPQEANAMLKEANRLWTIKKKTDTIEDIVFRAGGADDVDEAALRRGFQSLVRNPKRMAAFTTQEQAAMRKVANGGPVRTLLSLANKAMPNTGLAAMGSVMVGDPTIMGMSAIKGATGKGVNVSTTRALDNAQRTINPKWQRPYDPVAAKTAEDYANRLIGAAAQTGGKQVLDLGNITDRGVPAKMIPAR